MGSTGVVGTEGLAPIRFSDKSRSEVAAHFDPDKGQVSFSANTPAVPWIKGAQDRVSVFIQLGGMLAGNPAVFPVGSTISMYTVGPRDADTWTFLVEAEEKLACPLANRHVKAHAPAAAGVRPEGGDLVCAVAGLPAGAQQDHPVQRGFCRPAAQRPRAKGNSPGVALLRRTLMQAFCVVLHGVAGLYRTIACRKSFPLNLALSLLSEGKGTHHAHALRLGLFCRASDSRQRT
jgi:hypothetical protein